jgi:transcriptional antiterminator RfaH
VLVEQEGKLQWFCMRTQLKREHVAAAHLDLLEGVERFCPQVRFQRLTRRGKVWFTEAMFPSYIFARFDWEHQLRLVQSASGIAGAVRFGDQYLAIEDEVVADLRTQLDETDLKVFTETLEQGDEVTISEGPFMGIEAVVKILLPGRERVKLLLEFLGQPSETEVSVKDVYKGSFP